ncbi:MAG: YIP1 family protein [Pseudomonadota bacterium]
MIADYTKRLIEGFLAPRISARRLLDGGLDWPVLALLFLLGYLVETIMFTAFADLGHSGPVVTRHINGLIGSMVGTAVLSAIAWQCGRIAGGTASFKDIVLVLCWLQILIALLLPMLMPFLFSFLEAIQNMQTALQQGEEAEIMGVSGGATAAAFGVFSVWIWLLANYIGEAHGFSSTWRVLGAILALPLLIVLLATLVTGG